MHKVLSQSIAAELKEIRSAPDSDGSQAAGGPALSTTAKVLSIPIGADWVSITPRNFAACGTVRFALTPRLTIVVTTDALVSSGVRDDTAEPTAVSTYGTQDISDEMQDGDQEDFAMDSFPAVAATNYVYVGSHETFRGVAVDIGSNAQTNATVLTVRYPDGVGTWKDISDTDGTIQPAGDSMGKDGDVTWTVPTDWYRASLVSHGDTTVREPWSMANLYWTRWEWSAVTDANWDIRQLRALSKSTAYAELLEGQPIDCAVDTRNVANVEALTDAGTANVVVNAGILDTDVTGRKESFR
jgi:hypothetical protein